MMIQLAKYTAVAVIFLIWPSCGVQEEEKTPYTQTGKASYYARMFEGRLTANGETFRQDSLTAAHRNLPFGTIVQVTNLSNDSTVQVRINDRGPYSKNRIIDLSRSAAKKLDMIDAGVISVKLEVKIPAVGYSVSDSVVRG